MNRLMKRLSRIIVDESGDIPGWVLVTMMSAALVVSVWTVADDRLVAIVRSALDSVCGSLGC
jgi:hypothetical protein